MKSIKFAYGGINQSGGKARSFVIAESVLLAKKQLLDQNIYPSKITPSFSFIQKNKLSLSNSSLQLFIDQLKQTLSSGIHLLDALRYLQTNSKDPYLKSFIYQLLTNINQGHTLHDACKNGVFILKQEFLIMLYVGEISGNLELSLENMSQLLQRKQQVKKTLIQAISYPCFLLCALFIVLAVFFCGVIPKFAELFSQFDAELPWITRVIIELSEASKIILPYTLALSLFCISISIYLIKQQYKARQCFEKLLLKLPLIGSFVLNSRLALLFNSIEIMLSSGVPLTDCLEYSNPAANLTLLKEIFNKTLKRVKQGYSLQDALPNSSYLSSSTRQLIALGEKTGKLEAAFSQITTQLLLLNDQSISKIKMYLGNFILTLLGVMIGIIIAAMYLPIFQLGGVLS